MLQNGGWRRGRGVIGVMFLWVYISSYWSLSVIGDGGEGLKFSENEE